MNPVFSNILLLSILLTATSLVQVSSDKICKNDVDCALDGEICIYGMCKTILPRDVSCVTNGHCGFRQICIDERCMTPTVCIRDSDCSSFSVCIYGKCTDYFLISADKLGLNTILRLNISMIVLFAIIIVMNIFVATFMYLRKM